MIPKIKLPYYPINIPSTGKQITIKPFTVEIEKFLLGLDNSKDIKVQFEAMKGILDFCINEDIDISKLTPSDIQYIYLQCYKISINDKIQFNFKCPNADKNNCPSETINIPINKIEMSGEYKTGKILVDTEDGEYYLELKHINLDAALIDNDNLLLLSQYLHRMYDKDGNNEYILNNDDKYKLIKDLNMKQLKELSEFIDSVPKPSYKLKYKCSNCGYEFEETITDFFI